MNQEDLKWRKIGETNTCEKWSLDGEAYIDVPIGILDTIRQEERRKTIEEIIKYIPQEDNTLKDVGHNLAQASLYGFQRGFNYCRKIVLSTLENKKHE